ncbi:MAG: hypothetical protein NC412_00930 [Roseburia sp.]|nr:hypothetical protein [Roseburia sp.]MCM1277896.1 hypothetical protein [Robinsoniella sp.]
MDVKMKICPWCGNEMEDFVSRCSKCGEEMGNDNTASMYNTSGMYDNNSYSGSSNGMYDNSSYDGDGMYGSVHSVYPVNKSLQRKQAKGGNFLIGVLILGILLVVFVLPRMNEKKKYEPLVHNVVDTLMNDTADAVYSKYGFVDYNKAPGYIKSQDEDAGFRLTVDTEIKSISRLSGKKKETAIAEAESLALFFEAGDYFDAKSIDKVVRVKVKMKLSYGGTEFNVDKDTIQIDFVKVKGKSDIKVLQIRF